MKVGDYVRTKHYGITKVLKIYNNTTTNYLSAELDKIDSFGRLGVSVSNDEIIKSSPNIIDLIEVGDYVNGEQISRIKQCPEYHLGDGILIFNEHNETIYSNFRTSKYYDITSIVTKEQFSQMEYKL